MEFIYGWQKTKVRSLSDLDRKTLSEILSSRKQELRTYQRAQMIFLAAEGKINTQISEELKVTRPVVNKIIKRFPQPVSTQLLVMRHAADALKSSAEKSALGFWDWPALTLKIYRTARSCSYGQIRHCLNTSGSTANK